MVCRPIPVVQPVVPIGGHVPYAETLEGSHGLSKFELPSLGEFDLCPANKIPQDYADRLFRDILVYLLDVFDQRPG